MIETLSIMQPYFLPYIGYWQLIAQADAFVLLDDVKYINRGYINRNSILENNQAKPFVLNLSKASQNKYIYELSILHDNTNKILKRIQFTYKKAPYFYPAFHLLEEIFFYKESNLSKNIHFSICSVLNYLGLDKKLFLSSSLKKPHDLKSEEKIIWLCKKFNSKTYINPIKGHFLYSKERFQQESLNLNFLESLPHAYQQFNDSFVPNLSIIDILMFNSKQRILEMLAKCRVLQSCDLRADPNKERQCEK